MKFNHLAVNHDVMCMMSQLYYWGNFIKDCDFLFNFCDFLSNDCLMSMIFCLIIVISCLMSADKTNTDLPVSLISSHQPGNLFNFYINTGASQHIFTSNVFV